MMLNTAAQLACNAIYEPIDYLKFDRTFHVGESVCGMALIDGIVYIVMQGTSNLPGWRADFDVEFINHPILGKLHKGFNQNIDQIISVVLQSIPLMAKVVVTGHSKGASEGAILAAKLKLAGVNVAQFIGFACPNTGNVQFSDWMKKNIPGISFRNIPVKFRWLGDPVPMVPASPFMPPYIHSEFDESPSGWRYCIPTERHNADLYLSGSVKWNQHQTICL